MLNSRVTSTGDFLGRQDRHLVSRYGSDRAVWHLSDQCEKCKVATAKYESNIPGPPYGFPSEEFAAWESLYG